MANGTFDYKLGEHESAIIEMRNDIKEIKADVKDLSVWKWKVVGIVGGLALGGNMLSDIILKQL